MRLQILKFQELEQTHFDVVYAYYRENAGWLPHYYRYIREILEGLADREIPCGVAIVSSHKSKLASMVPYYDDGPVGYVSLNDFFDKGTPCSRHTEVCDFVYKKFSKHPSFFMSREPLFHTKVDKQICASLDALRVNKVSDALFGKESLFHAGVINGELGRRLEESFFLCDKSLTFEWFNPGKFMFFEKQSFKDFYQRDFLETEALKLLWNLCMLGDGARMFVLSSRVLRPIQCMFTTLGDGSLVELSSCFSIPNKVILNFMIFKVLDYASSSGIKKVYFNRSGLGAAFDARLQPNVGISYTFGSSFL